MMDHRSKVKILLRSNKANTSSRNMSRKSTRNPVKSKQENVPSSRVSRKRKSEEVDDMEMVISKRRQQFKIQNQWIPISEDSSVTSCSIIPAPVMDSCLSHCSSEETTPTELFRGSQFRFQNYFTTPKSLRFSPLPKFSWADSQEVWQLMLKKEEFYIRDSNMFDRHPSLQCRMRTILLDWLIEVCEVYRLHRETYYLAMDFLDRYMSIRNNVMKQQLQLIGITSLFIAAKLEEIYPPKLTDFAYVTDGACTENEILDQELIMLKCLKWGLSPMTVNNWLGLYLQVSNIEQSNIETEQSFVYPQFSGHSFVQIARLLDLCMLDIGCLQFTYSVIAASALYHMSSEDIALSVSGYKWTDILPCVQWMSPFAVTIRETGPLELKFFSTVASDDSHNIQTHSVTVALLEKAQARHQEMLNDSGRRSPEPQDQDMAAQIITLLTPPQSDKKPLPKTGYIKSGYEAS